MYCTYVSNNVYPWIGFHTILFRKCHFIYFLSVANWNCFLCSEFEGGHYEPQSSKPCDIGHNSDRMAAINKSELFQLIPVVLFLALNKFKSFYSLFIIFVQSSPQHWIIFQIYICTGFRVTIFCRQNHFPQWNVALNFISNLLHWI